MLGVSERRVWKGVLGQPRSTPRYEPVVAVYEQELTAAIVELASQYGRYGYRRIGALLRRRGWAVNHKRVERIWRQEGLKAPAKAAEALKAVAQRQVVRATATAVSQPRMDIRQIFARSPPAKGRVERTAGTFQDRLVTELRLARVETINGANEVPYRYPIL